MWNTIIYEPLYNAFVFILSSIPGSNIAMAIIIFTVLIKTLLFPLHKKNIKGQLVAKKIAPELKAIQEKYKNDRAELSKKTMEVYKKHGTNPFVSILLLFIQIPILLALYFVFRDGVSHQTEHLYYFIKFPENINSYIFGFIDTTKRFIPFCILVGVTQFIQAKVSFGKVDESVEAEKKKEKTFQDEFAKSMRIQMLYVLPVFIAVVSIGFPSAIALYWIVSNIYGTAQEVYVKKYTVLSSS